jgi:hypothetical protein
MKTSRVLLISTLIFALLVGGAFTLQILASTINVRARCAPHRLNLENPPPALVYITLWKFDPYLNSDVDPDTILVGGVVPLKEMPGVSPHLTDIHFKFYVDGQKLFYWVIWPAVWHMAPPSKTWVHIDITVTGQFYDSTPFEGTFTISVKTEGAVTPPPPP